MFPGFLRSYDVDRGCQVDTVSVTGVKTAAMWWTEFPEFRHKYGQLSYKIEYVYNSF